MDPVSVGLGVASLASGMSGNKGAQKAAASAAKSQKDLAKRQAMLFDTIFNTVKGADQQGFFNPDKRLEQLTADSAKYSGLDQGNTAGAMRVAGYKPGDSEIGLNLGAIKNKYALDWQRQANDIRNQSMQNKLNAYGAAGGVNLGGAMQVYGQQQQNAMSQMQNPGGLLASLAPFMQKQPGQQKQANFSLGNSRGGRSLYPTQG